MQENINATTAEKEMLLDALIVGDVEVSLILNETAREPLDNRIRETGTGHAREGSDDQK